MARSLFRFIRHAAALCAASSAFAGAQLRTELSPLQASPYADTEASAYVRLTNGLPSQAEFSIDVTFAPTMSNEVEVAFGEDRDRDGTLSFPETDVAFGLDCGRFFLERVQTGERHEYEGYVGSAGEGDAVESTTLRYVCSLDGIGRPPSAFYLGMANKWAELGDASTVVARTNGTWYGYATGAGLNLWVGTYGSSGGEAWPWSSSWNLMRVTRRGGHGADPCGGCVVRQRGGVVQMQ